MLLEGGGGRCPLLARSCGTQAALLTPRLRGRRRRNIFPIWALGMFRERVLGVTK